MARYDTIGVGYAQHRRPDPDLVARIDALLGDARTVVDVGAGAGSYEPADRHVVAVEPSDVMAAQRPRHLAPALRATAGALPLRDGAVDAALAIMTLHHWGDEQQAGLRELRRVARGPVVILTADPVVMRRMWLVADYVPEFGAMDDASFPAPAAIAATLGPGTRVEPWLVPRDTPDHTLAAFWGHPERVLDPAARAATSGFALLDDGVEARAVEALRRDLADGTWDGRHGHLRELDAHDGGFRLVVHRP